MGCRALTILIQLSLYFAFVPSKIQTDAVQVTNKIKIKKQWIASENTPKEKQNINQYYF